MIDTQEIYDKAQEFMSDNDPPDEIQTLFMTPLCALCDEVERLRGALGHLRDNSYYNQAGHDFITKALKETSDD